jgi:serine/threonine-protein phosphatase PP1 catalytic subunit
MNTVNRDQEYYDMVDKYTTADEPDKRGFSERLRRVRRKPGSDQLGAQGDRTATTPVRRNGHMRSQTWSNSLNAAGNDGAKSLLQNIQQLDLECSERRRRKLEEQRDLWNRTIPDTLPLYLGPHISEHA